MVFLKSQKKYSVLILILIFEPKAMFVMEFSRLLSKNYPEIWYLGKQLNLVQTDNGVTTKVK